MGSKPRMEFRGSGVRGLRDRLRQLDDRWPLLEPLPVTRFLGQSFGISNVSAHRVLAQLATDNVIWRAPNGRYFRTEARRLIERPPPVACLLRRLERWTEVGRRIMQGVDEACGAMDRALLLVSLFFKLSAGKYGTFIGWHLFPLIPTFSPQGEKGAG